MNRKIARARKAYLKKITTFYDSFNRANETPISSNGWTNWYSSNGADYGWYLESNQVRAMTTAGVTLDARLYRALTYTASTTYKFKFKVYLTPPATISGFSPFGSTAFTNGSTGLVFNFTNGSSAVGFYVYNNGVSQYSGAMSANNWYWVEIIVKPDSFVRFKYWLASGAEPTDYTTLNIATTKVNDLVCFRYQQYGPSYMYIDEYSHQY